MLQRRNPEVREMAIQMRCGDVHLSIEWVNTVINTGTNDSRKQRTMKKHNNVNGVMTPNNETMELLGKGNTSVKRNQSGL